MEEFTFYHTQSPTVGKLSEALSKAQGELGIALADTVNAHFKNKYAPLENVWAVCRAPLAKYGLSVTHTSSRNGDFIKITAKLLHSSGEWISSDYEAKPRDFTVQSVAALWTYGKRYTLSGVVGVASGEVDDDGEAAMPHKPQTQPTPRQVHKSVPNTNLTALNEVLSKPLPPHSGYTINFGKYKGQSFDQVGAEELSGYVVYLEKLGDKKPMMLEFIRQAKAYLKGEVAPSAEAFNDLVASLPQDEDIPF